MSTALTASREMEHYATHAPAALLEAQDLRFNFMISSVFLLTMVGAMAKTIGQGDLAIVIVLKALRSEDIKKPNLIYFDVIVLYS